MSAHVQSGSPGRLGTCTTSPPISSIEAVDGLGIAGAQVEDLVGLRGLGGHEIGPGHVGDEHEVPPLGAVADHRERLAVELLGQEDAEHRAVGAGRAHAGPIDVEHADRDHRQPVHLGPVQRRALAQVLAERVRILRADGRLLRGRELGGHPVAGGGRGVDELPDPRVPGGLQNREGAVHVGPHVLERPLDRRHDVPDAAEVEDVVDALEQGRIGGQRAHVDLVEGHPRLAPVLRQVLARGRSRDCRSRRPSSRGRRADRPCGCR